MYRIIVSLLAVIWCAGSGAAADGPASGPAATTQRAEAAGAPAGNKTEVFKNIEAAELLVPFYEGLRFQKPADAIRQAKLDHVQLAYPGPLSAPFFAWKNADGDWTAIYSADLNALPAQLELAAQGDRLELTFTCPKTSTIERVQIAGSWEAVARAVRERWKAKGAGRRLMDRFKRIDFYVQQWISQNEEPPLRENWTVEKLQAAMQKTPAADLVYVYGYDPGGVDLGGQYFWSDDALARVKRVHEANPQVSHLAWLNLRTFKYAMPRLGRQLPLTPDIQGMAKLFDGKIRHEEVYTYKAIDMCLADKNWQQSRLRELDRLIDAGFKVIQLDEFPIAPRWDVAPCMSKLHSHAPGAAAGEWASTMDLIKQLSDHASRRGVMLTCEEPSAALLPYIAGHIDRQFNDCMDLYSMCRQNKGITTIPLFSTMFSDVATPYTDVDGKNPWRLPPESWLTAHKLMEGE